MNLPELLPESERDSAYKLFKEYGGDKSFSLWVEMVQVAGVEKAFDNIILMYEKRKQHQIGEGFKQVMFTALMHHLDKQKSNN